MSKISELIEKCTVRIHSEKKSDEFLGSGFFVSPTLLITCSHVIKKEVKKIYFWHQERRYEGTVMINLDSEFPDVALISSEKRWKSCAYLNSDIEIGDKVYSYGYSDIITNGESVTAEIEGIPTSRNKSSQDLIKLKKGQIRPGFSGSPLLNFRTGGVCGIIKKTRNKTMDIGGRAIPIGAILNDFQELNIIKEVNINFHRHDPQWKHSLSKEQQANFLIDGDLTLDDSELLEDLNFNLILDRDKINNRFIPGSGKIKVGDLVNSKFQLKFEWESSETIADKYVNLIDEFIQRIQSTNINKLKFFKTLVLANPGIGKSTFTYKLFNDLIGLCQDNENRFFPIHIDLLDHTNDDSFGSKEWLIGFLKSISENDQIKWFGINSNRINNSLAPFLILDSLDEYLASYTAKEVIEKLNLYILKNANVLTCRTQYFQRYISFSDFARSFEINYILPWSKQYTNYYTKWYFEQSFPNKDYQINELIEYIDGDKNLREICKVPLRYNMTLEMFAENGLNYGLIDSLVSLYDNYVYNWLRREELKPGNYLELSEKLKYLEFLSWVFFDERKIGSAREKASFSQRALKKKLENETIFEQNIDIDLILADLSFRTLLLVQVSSGATSEPFLLKFIHKSFQEYFVARYLFYISTTDPKTAFDAFTRFTSHEVDQFFKDFLNTINKDLELLDRAVNVCIEAFEFAKKNDSKIPESKRRIARYQLAYNLGHFKSKKAYSYLIKHLKEEKDEWVSRSIIIGLSFGGDSSFLNRYIEDLYMDEDGEKNELNVGACLSYFGDQVVDEMNPEKDQGLPTCRNTVEKFIYELESERNRGSWRLSLYTILHLSNKREVSIDSFTETMNENLERFKEIIERLKKDPECKDWKEIKYSEKLIQKLQQ